MNQLLQFIQNHWALCSAFGLILIVILFEEFKNSLGGLPKISAQETTILLNHENAIILDLRDANAFAAGHILSAINIAASNFDTPNKRIECHKNKPLILIDNNDTHASSIGNKLKQQGFAKIYILAGGITTWKNAQLPLAKNQTSTH